MKKVDNITIEKNKIRDLFKVKLYTIRSETKKKREREREKKRERKREKKERKGEKRREKDVQGQLLSICTQFSNGEH